MYSKLPFGTGLCLFPLQSPGIHWSCQKVVLPQCNLSRSRKLHSLPLVEISSLYVICLSGDQMVRTVLIQNKRSTIYYRLIVHSFVLDTGYLLANIKKECRSMGLMQRVIN